MRRDGLGIGSVRAITSLSWVWPFCTPIDFAAVFFAAVSARVGFHACSPLECRRTSIFFGLSAGAAAATAVAVCVLRYAT